MSGERLSPPPSSAIYRFGSAIIRRLLRFPRLASTLTGVSRVWLRHARVKRHLEIADYDGVIDGGANVGEFAGLVRLARPDLPLVCVEPHPGSAEVLQKKGFRVIEAALWNRSGRLTLSQPTEVTTSCTVVGSSPPEAPTWQVDAIRLEDVVIPGRRLLIKLDLQGAEWEALEGMGALWERCGALILEVSYGPRGSYERIRDLLLGRGFEESATFNELDGPAGAVEADKLWVRREVGS